MNYSLFSPWSWWCQRLIEWLGKAPYERARSVAALVFIVLPLTSQPASAAWTVDPSFDPGAGASGWVTRLELQPDGRVLVGGFFTTIDGVPRNRVARLNTDGGLDASFTTLGGGPNDAIYALALQPDGRVLVGGLFTQVDGTPRNRVARLNANGSLDASFNPGTGANNWVFDIALQPDGRAVLAGYFTNYDGTPRNRVVRVNANGSLDGSFNPGTGANDVIYAVAVQPDGRILLGGRFTSFNGTARNRIVRLNADGSVDASFNPGAGADHWVYAIALQPDGRILLGGFFTAFDGVPRGRVARLNADGSLDATFDPGTGANGWVYDVAVQPDGRVLLAGDFTSIDGAPRGRIGRLNGDGSLDTSFDPGTGADGIVLALARQPDGRVLVGGGFSDVAGTARNAIARLYDDAAALAVPTLGTWGLLLLSSLLAAGAMLTLGRGVRRA